VVKIPIFEYECKTCNKKIEKLEFGEEMEMDHFCPECKGLMKRIISETRFELKYNNKKDCCSWGKDGYASSKYWDAYKSARARGEKVKPAGED